MSDRGTNLSLLALLAAALATGTIMFAMGSRWVLLVVALHGVIGVAITLTTPWKSRIMRRGLAARPTRSTWPSLTLSVLVLLSLVSGVLHSSGLMRRYGPLDDMQVHVGASLAAVPFAIWHVVARRTRPRVRDLSRRNFLRFGALLGTGTAVLASLEGAYRIIGLPGARRRFTGSYDQGSHDPSSMPSIIWLTDPRLEIPATDWKLTVDDANGERQYVYDEVAAFDDRLTATIDCTSGWFAEQDWHGVALSRMVVLPDDARSVVVHSATGYSRRFPIDDLEHLLLATGYEGRTLADRHGFPARLVAPGRRGFWWVKWVVRIETSDRPWWVQPTFPLQ